MADGVEVAGLVRLATMVHGFQFHSNLNQEKYEEMASPFRAFARPRMNPRGPRHGRWPWCSLELVG